MLLGNLVAILFSAFIVVVVSLIKPDNYDWKTTREIAMVDDSEKGKPCARPRTLKLDLALCTSPSRLAAVYYQDLHFAKVLMASPSFSLQAPASCANSS